MSHIANESATAAGESEDQVQDVSASLSREAGDLDQEVQQFLRRVRAG